MNDEIKHSYAQLELQQGATLDAVESAWSDLSKVWQPDRFPNDERLRQKAESRLNEINSAYAQLKQHLNPADAAGVLPDVPPASAPKERIRYLPDHAYHVQEQSTSPWKSLKKAVFAIVLVVAGIWRLGQMPTGLLITIGVMALVLYGLFGAGTKKN